jgi:Phycobilisome protein
MMSRMMKTVNATDNLYLTPAQQKEMLDYARSLPRRFAAVRTVEENEQQLVAGAFEVLEENQPHYGDFSEYGWDSAATDLRLVLRTLCQAVLVDDPDLVETKILEHLRKNLTYLDLPTEAVQGLFAGLVATAERLLPPDAYDMLAPQFGQLVMSMAPEIAEVAR